MDIDAAYQNTGIPAGTAPEEGPAVGAAVSTGFQQPEPDETGTEAEAQLARATDTAPDSVEIEALLDALGEAENVEPTDDEEGVAEKTQSICLTVRLVRAFMTRKGVEILFDGSLRHISAPTMAVGPDEIEAVLATDDIDHQWLVDELMLEVRGRGLKIAKGDVERAVRRVTREDRKARRNAIVLPLLLPPTDEERAAGATACSQLTGAVFETEASLTAACLRHFIWQVKQKLLGRPVTHHLMCVVYSPVQGSGKTTFILKLLAPLRELATGPVLLSDFADKRSADIYRFPVLFIDDMEQIERAMIPVLKSLVTSEGFRRRRLGTSMSEGHRQRTTLIGTANSAIDMLVADETGNRRFASLLFRNGQMAKGGDPGVWEAVDGADYGLLWRSVDAFGPGPIEAHLDALVALQEGGRPLDPLLAWLRNLDIGSEVVKRVTTQYGVKAADLHELFCDQTGGVISSTQFGIEMRAHVVDPTVPFGPKKKMMNARYYPLKGPAP